MSILYEESGDADLAVQLFDANKQVVALDLFSNLVALGKDAKTDTFIVPLRKYPTATTITLRRITGEIKVYGMILFPVVAEVEGETKTMEELAKLLGDPLSPQNPLAKHMEKLAKVKGIPTAKLDSAREANTKIEPVPLRSRSGDGTPESPAVLDGSLILTLDNRTNCVLVGSQRLTTSELPPGRYEVTMRHRKGEAAQPVYVSAYGHNPPFVDLIGALNTGGDKVWIELPRGGVIGAFLGSSREQADAYSVEIVIREKASNEQLVIELATPVNAVTLDPQRATSPFLSPGKYRLTIGGEGVRQGQGPNDLLLHWAFITAEGQDSTFATTLHGDGATTTVHLPRGGRVGAFLYDVYSGDNSGSVDLTIEPVR